MFSRPVKHKLELSVNSNIIKEGKPADGQTVVAGLSLKAI